MTAARVGSLVMHLSLVGCAATSTAAGPPRHEAARAIVVRLRPGDDLKRALDALARREGLEAASVSSCVGSVERVTLRFADRAEPTVLEGRREIVSLVGTLSSAGSHLHLAVADGEGHTLGGHLMEGSRVYTTAEIVVLVFPGLRFLRTLDPTYGYHELEVRPR
ncbi:MAG: PPC domain-containing DNA-binding protein [Polyangiales bacterium]